MSENPFDQLGLKKELVQYMHRSGQLDEFLRDYSRALQIRLHPDRGGDNDLSAVVNGAVCELRKNHASIPVWLQSMQNGHHPEYLEVIDGLAAEVERLRKVESEKEELAGKYAKLLASQAGKTDASKVRTASPRARRVSYEGEPESETDREDDMPEEAEAIPKVKRPAARRVSAEEPAARAERREAGRAVEPIVLENIILYDAKGGPAKTYKKVTLDGEAVKDSRGSYMTKHQDGWIDYFKSLGDGRVLPSLPIYYAVIERLQAIKHPASAGLLKDLKESWLCTGTRINYEKNTIFHPELGLTLECEIPVGDCYLDEAIKERKWRSALRSLLLPLDLSQTINTLQEFSGKRSYIWTPDASSRRDVPERALWLSVSSGRLVFGADYLPVDGDCRSRGVRLEA